TGTSVRPKLSRGFQPGFPDLVGYNAFTHAVRNYSAVTAACMATRQEVLEAVGGLDERLPIDYNDVDFCLKAIERGYRIESTRRTRNCCTLRALRSHARLRTRGRWRYSARDGRGICSAIRTTTPT